MLITQEELLRENEKLKDKVLRLEQALENANYWSAKKDSKLAGINQKIRDCSFLDRLRFLIMGKL